MPSPEYLDSPEYKALVEKADKAMVRRSAVISGNRYQPKIVWTLVPYSDGELRSLISAQGNSPLRVLNITSLGRQTLDWQGAPPGAQYAYLVFVEVRARFGDEAE
jgi:hypothetical protein